MLEDEKDIKRIYDESVDFDSDFSDEFD